MILYLVYLVFIVSAAMAAGGIILSSKLRSRQPGELFSSLLYFQVFIFIFGFYGIWGHAILKVYLSSYFQPELISRVTEISMLLGLPFLVFAWLMLIRLACGLSGRHCSNWFVAGFLVLNFTTIVTLGYLLSENEGMKPVLLLRTYFIVMNALYLTGSAFLLWFPGKLNRPLSNDSAKTIAPALLIVMLMQCIPVYFYEGQIVTGLLFIVAFFTGNAFLPVYLTYGAEINTPQSAPGPVKNIPFEEFCKKYDVSAREEDIIREICNGLSNKEIADKLFITVQTVKDHTHRIYIKTNVKSRAQLMNLVKGGT